MAASDHAEAAGAIDLPFENFKSRIHALLGLDLNAYKHKQMHRRLTSLRGRLGTETWPAFFRLLESSPEALDKFRNFVTINVSELYRNAEKFLQLGSEVLPELAQARSALRVWSAGCSYGAEPYTLAMVLDSALPGLSHSILATDIDSTILARAATGRGYVSADVRQVPAGVRAKYLESSGPDEWAIRSRIKAMVRFERHDLLRDAYPPGQDLIVCRNVVIYFTDEAKSQIYRNFYRALRPGGYLFVGGTEIVAEAREIGYSTQKVSFYQRPAAGA